MVEQIRRSNIAEQVCGQHTDYRVLKEGRERFFQREAHRMGVELFNSDIAPQLTQAGVALVAWILHGLYGKGHVCGSEGSPIVPEHILTQTKFVLHAIICDIPLCSQGRRQTPRLVQSSEAIKDQGAQVLIHRIGGNHAGRVDRVDSL